MTCSVLMQITFHGDELDFHKFIVYSAVVT